MSFMPVQINHLNQLMNAAQLRQGVISQNLANVNTPNYQRLDVQFEDLLAEHLRSPDAAAGNLPQPTVVPEAGLNNRADGNNVDVDREIGQLNRNAMMYQTYSQLMASQFDLLRRATSG